MANTTIQLKFSTVSGNTPSQLANGEVAINGADGKLFYSEPDGTIKFIENFQGPSGLNTEVQFNDEGVLGANASFTFDKANSRLNVVNARVNNAFDLSGNSVTTTSMTEIVLFSFSATEYGSAKFVVQAKEGTKKQITELLVVHDGTTAYSTEYAIIRTSTNLFDLDVDINSGNVRLKTTSTSANSTSYKILSNLILS
jgi:hypothetical protein